MINQENNGVPEDQHLLPYCIRIV